MPPILHDGHEFRYELTYKKDEPNSIEKTIFISDWKVTQKKIPVTGVNQPFLVTVSAVNIIGESSEKAKTYKLYSGESGKHYWSI